MYRELLVEIAMAERCSMSTFVAMVDRNRGNGESRASAVREAILQWLLDHPMTLPRLGLGKSYGRIRKPASSAVN
jgi:predicted DNA-binding ribbon-helix-helix protein